MMDTGVEEQECQNGGDVCPCFSLDAVLACSVCGCCVCVEGGDDTFLPCGGVGGWIHLIVRRCVRVHV